MDVVVVLIVVVAQRRRTQESMIQEMDGGRITFIYFYEVMITL